MKPNELHKKWKVHNSQRSLDFATKVVKQIDAECGKGTRLDDLFGALIPILCAFSVEYLGKDFTLAGLRKFILEVEQATKEEEHAKLLLH